MQNLALSFFFLFSITNSITTPNIIASESEQEQLEDSDSEARSDSEINLPAHSEVLKHLDQDKDQEDKCVKNLENKVSTPTPPPFPIAKLMESMDLDTALTWLAVREYLHHSNGSVADSELLAILREIATNPTSLHTKGYIDQPLIQQLAKDSPFGFRMRMESAYLESHNGLESTSALSLANPLYLQELNFLKKFWLWLKTPKIEYNISVDFLRKLTAVQPAFRLRALKKSQKKLPKALTHEEVSAILKLIPVDEQPRAFNILQPRIITWMHDYEISQFVSILKGLEPYVAQYLATQTYADKKDWVKNEALKMIINENRKDFGIFIPLGRLF